MKIKMEINSLGERLYTVYDERGNIIIRTTSRKAAKEAQQWQKT